MSGDLSAFLHDIASTYGERPAVIGERERLTFAELDTAAHAWATDLNARGLGSGSHIGLLGGNGPQWLAAAFGVWRAGATLVPISTFVTPRELGETLAHADVSGLIVQPKLRSRDYLETVRALPELSALRAVLPLAVPELPAMNTRHVLPDLDPDAVACILYTSGTTGRPKGVMLSHGSILSTLYPTAERNGLTSSDSLFSTLPLFWVAGLVIRALPTLACGCALVLLETFSVDAAIETLRRQPMTALHLRPPQVGQILAHELFTPELVTHVHRGGGRSQWYAPYLADARLITGYGMTEMSGYVTALHWRDDDETRRRQLGSALPGVDLRIVGADGRECLPGAPGEIQTRGPGMYQGYYKEPAYLGRTPDGWFATGDIGSIDTNGTFHFSGRSKDLLRIKGINVSPVEVERVLAAHPDVEAAYVVGLPPDGLDQLLVGLIVPKRNVLDLDSLRRHVDSDLSRYKQPENYVVLERSDVPLGGTSKPQRAELAELAMRRLNRSA